LLADHPRLAREWLTCAEDSLGEASGTGVELPTRLYGFVNVRSATQVAQADDSQAVLLSLEGKVADARAKIELALRRKHLILEIIHSHAPQPPLAARCSLQPSYEYGGLTPRNKRARVSQLMPSGFELLVTCKGKIREAVLRIPTLKISGNAGYAGANGSHPCAHTAHRLDCRLKTAPSRLTLFAETTPAPSAGFVSVLGVVLRGNRVTAASTSALGSSVDTPPSVTSTTPPNGAMSVSPTSDLTVSFSKSVTPSGSAFQIQCSTGGPPSVVPFTFSPNPPSSSFVIHPASGLPRGALCRVAVFASQVADAVGTNMSADYGFQFQTGS
jgi:hypothetical protein